MTPDKLTEEEFQKRFGAAPTLDELDRANCTEAGTLGHFSCGICAKCDQPRTRCGHLYRRETEQDGAK